MSIAWGSILLTLSLFRRVEGLFLSTLALVDFVVEAQAEHVLAESDLLESSIRPWDFLVRVLIKGRFLTKDFMVMAFGENDGTG